MFELVDKTTFLWYFCSLIYVWSFNCHVIRRETYVHRNSHVFIGRNTSIYVGFWNAHPMDLLSVFIILKISHHRCSLACLILSINQPANAFRIPPFSSNNVTKRTLHHLGPRNLPHCFMVRKWLSGKVPWDNWDFKAFQTWCYKAVVHMGRQNSP